MLISLIRCSKVTPATLITALIFVEKFKRLSPKPELTNEITATELLIVATVSIYLLLLFKSSKFEERRNLKQHISSTFLSHFIDGGIKISS